MMDALALIEQTRLSAFMREDLYAYFVALILHAWGMALLVGGGIAVNLRILGVAQGVPLQRFAGFVPWMKLGTVLAIISGIGLLAGYPAKALTNWTFALKFACLIGAALLTFPITVKGGKLRASAAIALWLGGVAVGKLLLYTYTMLLTTD